MNHLLLLEYTSIPQDVASNWSQSDIFMDKSARESATDYMACTYLPEKVSFKQWPSLLKGPLFHLSLTSLLSEIEMLK